MHHAVQGKELIITVKNDIGVLLQIAKVVAEKGANILAVHGSVQGENGLIRLVTEDNLRAADALREAGYEVREADVVLVDLAHRPGMLRHIAAQLAEEQIDIHHLYATAHQADDKCMLVFSSANNDRAVVVLNR